MEPTNTNATDWRVEGRIEPMPIPFDEKAKRKRIQKRRAKKGYR